MRASDREGYGDGGVDGEGAWRVGDDQVVQAVQGLAGQGGVSQVR